MRQTKNPLKLFILFTFLLAIVNCRASSETNVTINSTANANSRTAGEKSNTNSEAAKNSNSVSANGETAANGNAATNANNANKAGAAAAAGDTTVTPDSFGKIKIGMTVEQASQAFGTELAAPNGKGECYFVAPKQGLEGVDFMVIDGKIARVDVKSGAYATDKGAKIGDTEEKIKSLYPYAEVHPQKYDAKKHDIEVYSGDKKHLMIFETDGKVVTGFRAGRAEETGWVERCG